MRLFLLFSLAIAATLTVTAPSLFAQGMPLPQGTSIAVPQMRATTPAATPPSLLQSNPQRQNNAGAAAAGQITNGGKLSRTAGQEHRVYDLRPYTGYLTTHDRPEQAIVDWVLRETGSDVWFTEPFGFMNADRDSLSVYHTNEMHQVVAGIVDRFVAGEKEPQVLNLRTMTG